MGVPFDLTLVFAAGLCPFISLSQVMVSSDRYCVLTTCIVSQREFIPSAGSYHSPWQQRLDLEVRAECPRAI